jgi:hypothetical protein
LLLACTATFAAADPQPGQPGQPGTVTSPGLPAGAALSVDVPAQLSWSPGQRVPLAVGAKLAAAPDLTAVVGPFVDASTMKPLQSSFCLAPSVSDPCGAKLSLASNSIGQLWLVGTGDAEPGSYAGSVRLTAGNGLQTSVPLILNVSSDRWQLLGLAALALGVLLSFVTSVWLPHQAARDLALMPFAQLQPRVRAAIASLEPADKELRARARALLGQLSPTWLQSHGLVPPVWPSASPTAAGSGALQQHLDDTQAWLTAIETLAAAMTRAPDAATRKRLDDLAADPAFPQPGLQVSIDQILGVKLAPGGLGSAEALTPATLVFREEVRNFAFWLISSVLSVAVGYVLLVDGDPSFGGWKDATTALLWGLGVTTAGTKLADLGVGQVRAVLQPHG